MKTDNLNELNEKDEYGIKGILENRKRIKAEKSLIIKEKIQYKTDNDILYIPVNKKLSEITSNLHRLRVNEILITKIYDEILSDIRTII